MLKIQAFEPGLFDEHWEWRDRYITDDNPIYLEHSKRILQNLCVEEPNTAFRLIREEIIKISTPGKSEL